MRTGRQKPTVTLMCAEAAISAEFGIDDFLVVHVKGNTPEGETIINSKANIESKLEYFKKAYNDDFTLKANPEIYISEYVFLPASKLDIVFRAVTNRAL